MRDPSMYLKYYFKYMYFKILPITVNDVVDDVVHAESTNTFKCRLNSGLIRKYFTTIMSKFKELEVEV